MAEFPALPVWTDSYLADCRHLNDQEHGRYFQLLILIWRSPNCRIPNDYDWIARKFNRSLQAFENDILPIMLEFCDSDGNWITQKRLTKEWGYLQKQRDRGRAAANSRWSKYKIQCESNATLHGFGNAPTPTPTPTKEDIHTGGKRISPQWQPSEADKQFSMLRGMSEDDVKNEAGRFVDFFRAKDGPNALKADWSAAWRNWSRDFKKGKPNGNGTGYSRYERPKTGAAAVMAGMANLADRLGLREDDEKREGVLPSLKNVTPGGSPK